MRLLTAAVMAVLVRKYRPGDTLFMGYAQFVAAPDVALVCDLSKPMSSSDRPFSAPSVG